MTSADTCLVDQPRCTGIRALPVRAVAGMLWLLAVATCAMPIAAGNAPTVLQGDGADAGRGAPAPVLVFAAASLQPAFADLRSLPDMDMEAVTVSHAATSQLARQIAHGAPADVFVSADRAWMDHLQDAGLIAADSRIDLLGNALVLVARRDDMAARAWTDARHAIDSLAPGDRIAIAEPAAVPAGRYAKAAFEHLGLWRQAEPRLVRTGDVRAALAFVLRGEARLGVVYASDLHGQDAIHRLAVFPPGSHPPIVYPAAIVAGRDSARARALLRALTQAPAQAVFQRHGFITAAQASARPDDR
jgi:molybdate transport system substrate-binding protein